VTYLFRRSADPHETLHRWSTIKTVASQVILKFNGTISHQHGVGLDHLSYLQAEKGPLGIAMLKSLANTVDPHQIMNPGKLFTC
jgi:alkyldihydroxyacetonephosphate synthase